MKMLTARMKSRSPWEASELAPLAAAIVEAKGNGLRCGCPTKHLPRRLSTSSRTRAVPTLSRRWQGCPCSLAPPNNAPRTLSSPCAPCVFPCRPPPPSRPVSDDSPALRAGLDLKARLEKVLVLQDDMETALRGEPKLSELRALLHRADQLDINAEVRA
jgi:hypothetical protein